LDYTFLYNCNGAIVASSLPNCET